MTTQLPGNVMRPPVTTTVTAAAPEELMGGMVGLSQKGGTVESGIGVLRVGEMMKYDTSTHFWVKATSADVQAFNRTAVDATSEGATINVVLAGTVNAGVSGIVADKTTGTTPTLAANLVTIATTLGGRYVPAFNYIIF